MKRGRSGECMYCLAEGHVSPRAAIGGVPLGVVILWWLLVYSTWPSFSWAVRCSLQVLGVPSTPSRICGMTKSLELVHSHWQAVSSRLALAMPRTFFAAASINQSHCPGARIQSSTFTSTLGFSAAMYSWCVFGSGFWSGSATFGATTSNEYDGHFPVIVLMMVNWVSFLMTSRVACEYAKSSI